MGISPLYSIHRYSEEIYKVVAFKGVRDPENPHVRDKEQEQHYDAKLNEAFCRAKSLVLQYALCNPWDFFFTGMSARNCPSGARTWGSTCISIPGHSKKRNIRSKRK